MYVIILYHVASFCYLNSYRCPIFCTNTSPAITLLVEIGMESPLDHHEITVTSLKLAICSWLKISLNIWGKSWWFIWWFPEIFQKYHHVFFLRFAPWKIPWKSTMEIHPLSANLVKSLMFFTGNGDQNTPHLELRTRPGKSTKKKGVMAVDSSREASMSKGGCSTKSWKKIWTQ